MNVPSPRSSGIGYRRIAPFNSDIPDWQKQVSDVVNGMMDGTMNVTLLVTLTAGATSTMISDPRIGTNTSVILVPTTANAAAALATTFQTYPNAIKKQAVINHANNGQTDRTYVAVFLG